MSRLQAFEYQYISKLEGTGAYGPLKMLFFRFEYIIIGRFFYLLLIILLCLHITILVSQFTIFVGSKIKLLQIYSNLTWFWPTQSEPQPQAGPPPLPSLLLILHHVFYINFKHQLLSYLLSRTLYKTIFVN